MSATMSEYAAVEFAAIEIPVSQDEWRNALSNQLAELRKIVLVASLMSLRNKAQVMAAVAKEPEVCDEFLDYLTKAKATTESLRELIETAETRITIAMAAVIETYAQEPN
jgi:hypothetical protein